MKLWVGPWAWNLINLTLIEGMGVSDVEKQLDLPARSAKVALKTALSCAATCIHDDEAAVSPAHTLRKEQADAE